jgi:hypothetical protein
MVAAGRAINPKLKFYPLVYFQQPWAEFVQRFGTLVDGVVAAYPKSRTQVGNALAYLNGDAHGATAIVDYPRTQPSRPGDKGSIYADLRVDDPEDAPISFYWDDTDQSNNPGYHQAFVKVDGRIVWQADTAGETADRVVNVNLARFVRGRQAVRIELGVYEQRGVGKYPVTVRLDDIRLTGFDTDNQMGSQRLWSRKATGHFTVDLLPSRQEPAQVKLPMILMPAGEGEQYEKRYPDAGSPRNVAAKVRLCLDLVRDGRVEGVVTYCLPKDGPTFEAVGAEFRRAAEALRDPKDLATTKNPRRPD